MTLREFAKTMDHTLLAPQATASDLDRLVEEARKWAVFAVCVQPTWVAYVREKLAGTDIRVATVIGFPHGVTFPEVKVLEARMAVEAGADELDMVIHAGWVKEGQWNRVAQDIQGVVAAAGGRVVKVILETGALTEEEKEKSARVAIESGAQFVKTSTGYGPGGATVEDVRLLARVVHPLGGKVKASGGIRSAEQALALLQAGADRLGLSRTVQVLEEYRAMLEEKA